DGGFIGVTAVDGDRLGEPVAANRFFQQPQGGLFIPVLREQKVNRLALLIDRAIEIPPLPFDLNIGFVDVIVTTHKNLALMFHTQVYMRIPRQSWLLATLCDVIGIGYHLSHRMEIPTSPNRLRSRCSQTNRLRYVP